MRSEIEERMIVAVFDYLEEVLKVNRNQIMTWGPDVHSGEGQNSVRIPFSICAYPLEKDDG